MLSYIIQSIFTLSALLLTVVYFLSKYKYLYWKGRNVPYEEPTMLVGNLTFLMRTSLWKFLYNLGKKYHCDYYGIFLGWKPVLVVHSPALAKKILLKDTEHFQDRYLYSGYEADPLGTLNLFNVKNPIWTQMRHQISPMFTTMRLKTLTELMNINSKQLVDKIQRDYVENKQPVDLKAVFSMYTSDTVAYTVFGLRVSALNDASSPLWFITRHMVKWTFWRGLEFALIFLLPYIATLLRLKFFSQPATNYIKQLFWNVVEQRKKTSNSSDRDLVNHLLQLKENLRLPADANTELADNLMLAQAAVFILGAIETSSTTLSYCLHELAHHHDEQGLRDPVGGQPGYVKFLPTKTAAMASVPAPPPEVQYSPPKPVTVLTRMGVITSPPPSSSESSPYSVDVTNPHPKHSATPKGTSTYLYNQCSKNFWVICTSKGSLKQQDFISVMQEKLFQEINNSLETSGKDVLQYGDLAELKYLTACINETLRKYPPLPYLDRLCNKTVKVDDNLTIEEGVPVFVNVVGIHYDEQHYPEPEQWRPERMSNVTENDNLRFTFLPFGDGPRFCIGKRYGMLQIRTALAQMVARYRFEPCDDEPYDVTPDPYSVVLGPITGGKVKFVPR